MFNGLHHMYPTDAEIATQTLTEEGSYRFPSFSASDAVTLVITSSPICWNQVLSIFIEGTFHPKTIPLDSATRQG